MTFLSTVTSYLIEASFVFMSRVSESTANHGQGNWQLNTVFCDPLASHTGRGELRLEEGL